MKRLVMGGKIVFFVADDEGETRRKVWFQDGQQEKRLARETAGGQGKQGKEHKIYRQYNLPAGQQEIKQETFHSYLDTNPKQPQCAITSCL